MKVTNAVEQYHHLYGEEPSLVARAPGRVNIIGEHVDYNDGLVLPFAIAQHIVVAAGSDDSGYVSAYSAALSARVRFAVDVTEPAKPSAWENYVRGMLYGLREAGAPLAGAKLWIGGDLAPGSGMSSSAALCVSAGMALAKLAGVDIDREQMARMAQASEHHFAGTPCGLMDQMAACFGRDGHALLLDCRDLSHQNIPCRPTDIAFLIIPSGVKHALADGSYEKRVHACRHAVAQIAKDHADVKALRDVSVDMLAAHKRRLDEQTYRRARHVVTEIRRLNEAVQALQTNDWPRVGALLWQTQDSLRDDYEVSCAEIDDLIDLLRRQNGVLGARMVGGGFGGIVLALVQAEALRAVEQTVQANYHEPRRINERPFTVTPSSGAAVADRRGVRLSGES